MDPKLRKVYRTVAFGKHNLGAFIDEEWDEEFGWVVSDRELEYWEHQIALQIIEHQITHPQSFRFLWAAIGAHISDVSRALGVDKEALRAMRHSELESVDPGLFQKLCDLVKDKLSSASEDYITPEELESIRRAEEDPYRVSLEDLRKELGI